MGVYDRAVTVPLEICDSGILGHQTVNDPEDKILHLGIAQIEHQLVTGVYGVAVGIFESPLGVFLRRVRFADSPSRVLSTIRI